MTPPRAAQRDGTVAQAATAFAKGKAGPVVLLAGPEKVHAEELIDLIVTALVPEDFRAFNLNRYRGGQDDVDQVLTSAATLPMFTERRVVILQDADNLNRGEMERLAAYIEKPAPETVLVLTAEETGTKVPAALRKVPERYTLWRPFPKEAVQWVVHKAKTLGKDLSLPVADDLYALCAGDSGDGRAALSDLSREIEKMCLMAGERKALNREDLVVVGRHAEARVLYQIEAAIAERNLPMALQALSSALLFPRENGAVRIVAMLGERFRKMLVARDRMDAGYSVKAVVAGMWFPGPSGSTQFLRSVNLFRRAELARAIVDLAALDRALKTGRADPEAIHMEALFRRLCGVQRNAAAAR